MNEITIEIGRLTKSGEIESYDTKNVIIPNKIVNNAFLDVPLTLHKISGARSSICKLEVYTNTRYLSKVYGEVLDRIVDKLEFAKDLASGSLDDINKWINILKNCTRFKNFKQRNSNFITIFSIRSRQSRIVQCKFFRK